MKGSESMKNMTESEYRQLVEEYSDMVTRLCVVHTGNFSDAEDCYQNVFFKLFKQMKKRQSAKPESVAHQSGSQRMPECFAVSFEEKHSRFEQHNVFLKGRQRHRDT